MKTHLLEEIRIDVKCDKCDRAWDAVEGVKENKLKCRHKSLNAKLLFILNAFIRPILKMSSKSHDVITKTSATFSSLQNSFQIGNL